MSIFIKSTLRSLNYIKNDGIVFISRISVIEILGGLKTRNAEKQIETFRNLITKYKILDTTDISAEISSNIFSELWKKGKHSGNYDILIAGIAIANNLILVTNNIADYENITNLKLENWTIEID